MEKNTFDKLLLISIDTLRSDCLNINPFDLWTKKYNVKNKPVTTPVDKLAQSGVFLANCLSAAPYTSASHATVFTGCWPLRHGLHEFFNNKLSKPSLFSIAKNKNYKTIFKTDFPVILGEYLGFTTHVDRYLIEDDDGFVDEFLKSEKSIGFAHFGGVHIPYGFHNLKFGGDAYRNTVTDLISEINTKLDIPSDQLLETYRSKEDRELLLHYKAIIQYYYENGNYDRLFELYIDGITHFMKTRFDKFLKTIMSSVDIERTLIVLFGDHGEEYDKDSYGHHNTLNEGVLRVPVIFVGGDLPSRIIKERTRTVDIAPTILDLMGWSDSKTDMDGESIEDVFFDNQTLHSRPCFSQAWTSDTDEFVAFQKKLFQQDSFSEKLRHVLYKESCTDGNFKVLKQYFFYGEHGGISGLKKGQAHTSYFQYDDQCFPNETQESEVFMQLEEQLKTYNKLLKLDSNYNVGSIPEELRIMLRDIGYRI